MILLILILIFIIGIVLICKNISFIDGNEFLGILGTILTFSAGLLIILSLIHIFTKPLDYKHFIVKYETLKEIKTSSIDIRDTNYTQLLIEINNTIRENKEFINDFWIGIYYNKDIANVEYIAKEE